MLRSFTIKESGKELNGNMVRGTQLRDKDGVLFHTRNTKHIRQHKRFRRRREMSGTCVSNGKTRSITNHNVI